VCTRSNACQASASTVATLWHHLTVLTKKSENRFSNYSSSGRLFGPAAVVIYLLFICAAIAASYIGIDPVWRVLGSALATLIPEASWFEPTAIAVVLACYAALLGEGLNQARTPEARSNRDFIVSLCTGVGSLVSMCMVGCIVGSVYRPALLPQIFLILAIGLLTVLLSAKIGSFWIGNPAKQRDSLLSSAAVLENMIAKAGSERGASVVRSAAVPGIYLAAWCLVFVGAAATFVGVSAVGDMVQALWLVPPLVVSASSAFVVLTTSTIPRVVGVMVGGLVLAVGLIAPVGLVIVLVGNFPAFSMIAIAIPTLFCTVSAIVPQSVSKKTSRVTINSAGRAVAVKLLVHERDRMVARAMAIDERALEFATRYGMSR